MGEVVRLERIFLAVVEFVVEFAAWSGDPCGVEYRAKP
jgi:hypothetical protein